MNRKNLVVFMVTCLIMVLFSELFIRTFFPQQVQLQSKKLYLPDDKTGYRLASNYNGFFGNRVEYMTAIATNSYGLRNAELPARKLNARLLVLGDSFVFGQGVEQEETISAKLEKGLKEKGKLVTVINAGVPGYGTVQQAEWLKHYGLALKPDMVLVGVFLGNDIKDNGMPNDVRSPIGGRAGVVEESWYLPIADWLYENIHIYGLVHNFINARADAKKIDGMRSDVFQAYHRYNAVDTERRKLELEKTRLAITKLNNISVENNIRMLVFLIPEAVQVEHWRETKLINMVGSDVEFNFNYPNAVITALFAEHHIQVVDLTAAFKEASKYEKPLYYPIDGHWNVAGHSLAARSILQYIYE